MKCHLGSRSLRLQPKMNKRPLGPLALLSWPSGPVPMLPSGPLALWSFGPLALWPPGPLALWPSGHVSLWSTSRITSVSACPHARILARVPASPKPHVPASPQPRIPGVPRTPHAHPHLCAPAFRWGPGGGGEGPSSQVKKNHQRFPLGRSAMPPS